jgi:hypothetical protein
MAVAKKGSAAGTAAEPASPKVLAVRTPKGKIIRLMSDLPYGKVIDIASANDVSWAVVVGDPLFSGSGQIALDVYKAALEVAGEPVPEFLSPKLVFDAFDTVDDDLPDVFEDGTPTGGAPATT